MRLKEIWPGKHQKTAPIRSPLGREAMSRRQMLGVAPFAILPIARPAVPSEPASIAPPLAADGQMSDHMRRFYQSARF